MIDRLNGRFVERECLISSMGVRAGCKTRPFSAFRVNFTVTHKRTRRAMATVINWTLARDCDCDCLRRARGPAVNWIRFSGDGQSRFVIYRSRDTKPMPRGGEGTAETARVNQSRAIIGRRGE